MFKDNLKKYRKEKGFSQNDLAQKLFCFPTMHIKVGEGYNTA